MEWNRKNLLDAARALGYNGKPVEVDVKAFYATKGMDVDADGITVPGDEPEKTVTLKWADVWGKTASLVLASDEGAGNDDGEGDGGGETTPLSTKRAEPQGKRGDGWRALAGKGMADQLNGNKAFGIRSERERQVKAYNRRVSTNESLSLSEKAVFESGEQSEQFGAFFRLATLGHRGYSQKKVDLDICGKAAVEFDNSLLGVTVPIYFSSNLIWLTEQYGTATKLASLERMLSDSGVYPRQTSNQAMVPSAEGAAKTEADDGTDGVMLNAREASLIKQCSYQLYEDSAINVGDRFARNFAEAGARRIDLDYFQGDGTATYNNHIGLVGKLTGNRVASATNWASQTQADHTNMLAKLENVDDSRIRWAGTRQHFYAAPQRLQIAANQFTKLTGGPRDGAQREYLDIPYHFAQVNWEVPRDAGLVPSTNSGTYNLFVGDFAAASKIGIRDDIKIFMSEHYGFNKGLLAWRGTMRYAINIHLSGRSTDVTGQILALKNS